MKALRLEKPGSLLPFQCPEPPPPGPGEALVQVHRIGICGTDIHAYHGRQPFFEYPRILGHELGVEVLAIGPGVSTIQPGDRCSVEPYLHCGHCIACRRGKPNCCREMQVLGVHRDGGMRERFLLPADKLHPSVRLSFDDLALVETLAIGSHAVARADIQKGEHVAIIGAGPIGLSVIPFVREKGGIVTVIDLSPERLEFCHGEMGVEHIIRADLEDPARSLEEITRGDMPTCVIDATGNPGSMQRAFLLPAHGGRMVFVGLHQGEVSFNDPAFHKRELTILASRNALSEDFRNIIKMIESNKLSTAAWITRRLPFGDGTVFEQIATPQPTSQPQIKTMLNV